MRRLLQDGLAVSPPVVRPSQQGLREHRRPSSPTADLHRHEPVYVWPRPLYRHCRYLLRSRRGEQELVANRPRLEHPAQPIRDPFRRLGASCRRIQPQGRIHRVRYHHLECASSLLSPYCVLAPAGANVLMSFILGPFDFQLRP